MTPRERMVTSTPSDVESEWRFGPVSGPLSGGLTAVLAAVAEPVVAYPHWAPVAVTAVGAGAVAAIGALRRRPLGLLAYRSACWVGAGAWTTWIASQGWSWAAGVVLGGGALAAGIAAELVREVDLRAEVKRSTTPADEDQPGRRLYPRELTVKAAIDALLNLPLPGVQIISIEDWESGSGYTVRLEFPAETGYGDEELRSITLRLARRLRLPAGCVPEVDEGDLQGEVILRIPTLDDLSETTEYPADYSPLSIYDEHPLGIFGDQGLATDEMRESSKLIGGRKGGGKTNVEDVYAANLQRTEDALIWDIDLNGGGMSAFWMLPFAQGEVPNPPIDWVAADADEALLMSCVALAIAKARKAQYAGLRARANTRLLPLDRKLPAIELRVDEGAEVLGDSCPYPLLRENIKELHRIGREIGENFIISTLRPTGEMIPVEIRKNSSTRVGTRVEEDSELHYLFPQAGVKLKSRMLKTPGEAFLSRGDAGASDGPVRRMKWFHLLPDRIREVVLATNHLRPELDEFSRMVADAPFTPGETGAERGLLDPLGAAGAMARSARGGRSGRALRGGEGGSARPGDRPARDDRGRPRPVRRGEARSRDRPGCRRDSGGFPADPRRGRGDDRGHLREPHGGAAEAGSRPDRVPPAAAGRDARRAGENGRGDRPGGGRVGRHAP
jgi:hypothetical protein